MLVMKLLKQLALSAFLVAAVQSHQVLSQSQSSSSSSSMATDTPSIMPPSAPTEAPTVSPSSTPTETPTPTLTPSVTPVATEESHLEHRGHPHPTPVPHQPKFTRAPVPVPVTPRPTPEAATTEEERHKSEAEKLKVKGPRALRGNDESDNSDSNESPVTIQSQIVNLSHYWLKPKQARSITKSNLGTHSIDLHLVTRVMLGQLPDECKQHIWRHFEAQELCRVACVASDIARGANSDAVWKKRARTLIASEQSRVTAHRTPVECGLKRQNARRDLLGASSSSSRTLAARMSQLTSRDEAVGSVGADDDDDGPGMIAEDSTYWRHLYRDVHVSIRAFDAANASFEAAKTEIQELKRERADLKELLQAAKSKNQSEKHVRRIQMSCVRWMNRSHRRQTASKSLMNAQSAALSKAEITDELQMIESSIQMQSKMLFSLRSQYQKCLHRMTTQLARGTQMMRDLGCEV